MERKTGGLNMAIGTYYSTLEIIRPENERANPLGGQIVEWIRIPFKGVITRSTSQSNQSMGKSGELTDATLICEVCDIKKGDRVMDIDGAQYLVKGNPNNVMKRGHHLECDLQTMTGVSI
jgi:hypothetical protein